MRPYGRRTVVLVALASAIALMLGSGSSARAQTAKAEAELTTKEVGSKEIVLGDYIADSILQAVKCDAAFIAADYFNEVTLPKGNVSITDLMKALVMPGDTITVIKLTGDQIQRGMERSLFLYPKYNSGFLQFSGLNVTFRPDAEPDKRVVSIRINGDTLDAAKTYRVAMPTPLARGGLAYFKIWKATDKEAESDKTLFSALSSYLNDHKSITKGEDRLVAKGK